MKWISVGVVIGALACATISGVAQSASSTTYDPSVGPAIHIEDVDRFYKVYDAAGGHPTAEQLQHDYVDLGSDGLHEFAKLRNISGERIANTLASHPEIYSSAKRCMLVLPRVRRRLEVALRTLGRLYPEARFPPVTIAVGRGKPVGVGGGPASGVDINILCHLISAGAREPAIGAHVTVWFLMSILSPPVMACQIIDVSGPQHFNSGCRDLSSYQQSMSPSAAQCCNENSKNSLLGASIAIRPWQTAL
jgi:hypothetical protein